jgi:uncharacterized protein (DUF362 family)
MMSQPKSKRPITRRNFLRLLLTLGGSVLAAPFLQACERLGLTGPTALPTPIQPTPIASIASSPTPSPNPEPTAAMDIAKVALIKTRDRATGVRGAVQLLGSNPIRGKQILLKPNFNSADPAPASTHLTTLRTLVELLQEMGAGEITVADRSGMGDSRSVMGAAGVFALARELGFETLSFEDLQSESDWELIQPAGSHWKNGFPFARPVLEAGAVVQTCCLKPHRFGGHFTMSLKNTVGMVGKYRGRGGYNYMNELHASPYQRLMIAEANTAYTPALVVLDGVEAFIDQGPDTGTKVFGDVILAGTDRVAIDAVGLAALRFLGYKGEAARGSIFQQEQIARAVELGLGVDSPEKIQILTGDSESEVYAAQIRDYLL